MSIHIGNKEIKGCYIDGKEVSDIYIGNKLIYSGIDPNVTYGYRSGTLSAYAKDTNIITAKISNKIIKDNKKCTNIGNSGFKDCTLLSSIIIPDTITNIESYAFGNCVSLKEVIIPDSVINTGTSVFNECSNLTSIIMSKNLKTLESNFFYKCINLSNFDLWENLENFNLDSIGECKKINALTIPTTLKFVTAIGNTHYVKKINIKDIESWLNITFYNRQSSLCNNTELFYKNEKIINLPQIPSYIHELKDHSFSGYKHFDTIIIPRNITKIGNETFYRCSTFRGKHPIVYIPDTVKEIGSYAFFDTAYTVKCQAKSKPPGWAETWNYNGNTEWGATLP